MRTGGHSIPGGYSVVQLRLWAITFKLSQFNSPVNSIAILGKSLQRVMRAAWKAWLKAEHESVYSDHCNATLKAPRWSYENMGEGFYVCVCVCVCDSLVLLLCCTKRKTFGQESSIQVCSRQVRSFGFIFFFVFLWMHVGFWEHNTKISC